MANVLGKDKQISITAALAEGSSIRAIERMTGVHRDTIMRLGVKIGQGCAKVLDQKMRSLDCKRLECRRLRMPEKRKKVGRPRLPKGEARKMMQFRAQPDERKAFERAAKQAGLTLSDWIRQTLNDASK